MHATPSIGASLPNRVVATAGSSIRSSLPLTSARIVVGVCAIPRVG